MRHRSALVVGLGLSGYSAVRYLLARGLNVRVWDANPRAKLAAKLKRHYSQVDILFDNGDFQFDETLVVASPGVSIRSPILKQAAQQGAEVVGDIELFVQENQQALIAITGSNGKSTVTTLVGEMCSCANKKVLLAGNIGTPVLDA